MKRAAVFAAAMSVIVAMNARAQTSTPSAPAHSAIMGRIRDERHAAIPSVDVMLRELPATGTVTNDSGRFVISNVAAGSYHLVLRRGSSCGTIVIWSKR